MSDRLLGTLRVEDLTEDQAEALAQFCKRVTYGDAESRSTSQSEAYLMLAALACVARALREKGFAPR